MALDPTAREANFRDSIKKYFVDNLETTENIPLTFDKALSSPNLQGKAVHKWVTVLFGSIHIGTMSEIYFRIFCCTRQDNEGFKLAQLKDTVMGYLINDGTVGDGQVRVPFYRSYANQAWTLLGSLLVIDVIPSDQLEAPDETKYIILTVRLKTASKM
ncbi:MAG: hypothetical protein E3J43_07615 [Candidatus Heimdallarchaeota archaeon]|nr:MAG: hypothetical protein E3J43_07615 [Candidatus Heimdallarchaeota archaeon]